MSVINVEAAAHAVPAELGGVRKSVEYGGFQARRRTGLGGVST
ncbi:hypothetical protein [Kribbella sp. NPDC048915]